MYSGYEYQTGSVGYESCGCNYSYGGNNTFSFILVLFILLVIIGCTCYNTGSKKKC